MSDSEYLRGGSSVCFVCNLKSAASVPRICPAAKGAGEASLLGCNYLIFMNFVDRERAVGRLCAVGRSCLRTV